jgi:putative FmdB family regulatory protein
MPTYDFDCPSGHRFEKFYRKMTDAVTELPCPECGVIAVRRISGGAALLFKGSGFYITDYGKDGKKGQRESSEKNAAGDGGAKSAEAKPAETKSSEPKAPAADKKGPTTE